ncbi:glycosyltransferase family 2 protein [Methylobacterium sp. J-072]|uniref:glycosyltransferase family 2 protein n=1 Tax=Methylobacterium sp. J-072 TaxID=2836651 RepID=UPI001FB87F9E|nr:glycosyltransferase family A protein [Methylobacterium sp. J-072]MCJ2094635.1 glycosyltransferase family 2 protein [Methylobacterium sp. J-072]
MPGVDVVIPCYNYGHYLEHCVATVTGQRDVAIRILIVDDHSPDDTPAVAQRLAAADPRIQYTRNPRNLGLVGSINRGVMDWASADYTLVLSADDALTPGALARAVAVMERHPEVGMTYGLAVVFGERNDEFAVADTTIFDYATFSGAQYIEDFCRRKNGVASPTALVRTRVQKDVGGYDAQFPHTCDVEMWMRIATRYDIAAIEAPQAYYRWHGGNMSSAYIDRPLSDLREQLETCEHLQRTAGAHLPGFAGWVADMRTRFAREACWLAGLACESGNDAAMRQCLAFATAIEPTIRTSKAWWGCQARRVLAALDRLRGRAGTRLGRRPFTPFVHGSLFGRWPGREAGADHSRPFEPAASR